MRRFYVGDLVYYKTPDGSKVKAEVIGYAEIDGELRYVITGVMVPVRAETLEYIRSEPEFEVGEQVLYDDGGPHPFPVKIMGYEVTDREVLYFISGLTRPVSGSRLIKIEEQDDAESKEAPHFNFECGDVVRVLGYPFKYYVVSNREEVIFEGERANLYLLEPQGEEPTVWNMLEVFEEDMVLIQRGPQEFKPKDKRLPKEIPTRRSEEFDVLERLKENRRRVEMIRNHIDRKLALYSITKDEKYLRHAARLKQWADKIPTRAYEL
jgi:hypothetical protein